MKTCPSYDNVDFSEALEIAKKYEIYSQEVIVEYLIDEIGIKKTQNSIQECRKWVGLFSIICGFENIEVDPNLAINVFQRVATSLVE